MNQKQCNIYPFLKAVRGCWHNALFVKCGHDNCPYGQATPCKGYLLAVDADGTPLLMPADKLQLLTGESIEPEGCRAVLNKQAFETVYSLYIEWHTTFSTGCPLLQLYQTSYSNSCGMDMD
ncbi:MAG: hypothetical protein NC331_06505 [Lachnospiraceae bacterium]|nr:hypothetical protein [Lachnospiraceae bacterium]MCM1239022.1 hypothetical protein [Lachnospiraceae bacterium]